MKNRLKIIAELAQGFEGKPEQAHLLLKAATAAGADAAKFQLVYAAELASPDYKYYDLFKSLEMPDNIWKDLQSSALENNIELQLDIFGLRSLELAEKIGVRTVKLHGTDIANIGLLNKLKDSSIEYILLGAGGAYLSELNQALEILKLKKVVILLGFQGYPTPNNANHIARVRLLSKNVCLKGNNVSIGFADHSEPTSPLAYALPAMAIGAGAVAVEKHLTLGKVMKLEDHESALNPDEFAQFVSMLNDCADAFGLSELSEDFGMTESEIDYRKMIRRHVVASHDLPIGSVLMPTNIMLKRTSTLEGALTEPLMAYNKSINREIKRDTAILLKDINL